MIQTGWSEDMAKQKRAVDKPKSSTWAQRKPHIQSIAILRWQAEMVTALADDAKSSVAEFMEPLLTTLKDRYQKLLKKKMDSLDEVPGSGSAP